MQLPAPSISEPSVFQGRPITTDPVSLRYILEQIIIEQGQDAAELFVTDFEDPLIERHGPTPESDTMYQDYRLAILNAGIADPHSSDFLPILREQLEVLNQETRNP